MKPTELKIEKDEKKTNTASICRTHKSFPENAIQSKYIFEKIIKQCHKLIKDSCAPNLSLQNVCGLYPVAQGGEGYTLLHVVAGESTLVISYLTPTGTDR